MRVALVLGGGNCVWSDVDAALELGEFAGVVACNDVAAAWPGELDAAVSLHAEKMGLWMSQRRAAGHPEPKAVLGHAEFRKGILKTPACLTGFTPFKFDGQTDSGSSGLFALKVALINLGFDRAVLCGVPMEALQAHFFDTHKWGGAISHRRGWKQALPQIADRARSMSGWTREILGSPTTEWLSGA